LTVTNNLAFLATTYGLEIYDVSNPRQPAHLSLLQTAVQISDLASAPGVAFLVNDFPPNGLLALDLRSPEHPAPVSGAPDDKKLKNIAVQGDVLFSSKISNCALTLERVSAATNRSYLASIDSTVPFGSFTLSPT